MEWRQSVDIDELMQVPVGTTKTFFSMVRDSLTPEEYVIKNNRLFLSEVGFILLSGMYQGINAIELKRKVLENFKPEVVETSPIDIILEQLGNLEKMIADKPAHRGKYTVKKPAELECESVPEHAEDTVPKKRRKTSRKCDIESESLDAWVKEVIHKVKKLAKDADIKNPVQILTAIYRYMTKNYGFVMVTAKQECKNRNELDDYPSVLLSIGDDEKWRSIFDSVLADVESTGFIASKVYNGEN